MIYKGLFHVHSKYSDGKYSLFELKNLFSKHYNFIFLADHVKNKKDKIITKIIGECKKLSDNKFLLIPGVEINEKGMHILYIGLHNKNYPLKIILHPNQKLLKLKVFSFFKKIDGIEVWNRFRDGRLPSKRSTSVFKEIRKHFPNLFAIGGLDLHERTFVDLVLEIEAERLTEKELIHSIRKKRFLTKSNLLVLNPDCSEIYFKNRFLLKFRETFVRLFIFLARNIAKIFRKIHFKPKLLAKLYHRIFGLK